MKQKTKKINKKDKKGSNKNENLLALQEEENNDDINKGEPVLKNLSDFVTAITPVYVSKPIYTGGRILTGQHKIYAACTHSINIYDIKTQSIIQKIKHVNSYIILEK